MKYIELHTNGIIPAIKEHEGNVVNYDTLKELIAQLPQPFDWFEIVRISAGGSRFMMIVDEEGKLVDKEENYWATKLYDSGIGFDYIAGDAIILSDHGDEDMYFMTDDEVGKVLGALVL